MLIRSLLAFVFLFYPLILHAQSTWHAYGGDGSGTRYMPFDQINRSNVNELEVAWTFRTGELGQDAEDGKDITFEATPIFFENTLYFPTAFGEIFALHADSGTLRWTYNPEIDRSMYFSEVTSRGVSLWIDTEAGANTTCQARIIEGTIDARLIAIDARTGKPCSGFGTEGVVDLNPGHNRFPKGRSRDYQVTSPPAILGNHIIVGSSIGDNWNVNTGRGTVRAFDARTGDLRWAWDPIDYKADSVGAANAWSIMAFDEERDLVFVPTSSPSPDFYGGKRPGSNAGANSVVALKGSTGEVAWAFQTIHHDLWDYDIAAQPALIEINRNGERIPAVAQATKTGMVFILHRETGEPLYPVEERPVIQSDIPGESSWPTQPFVTKPAPIMPHEGLSPDDAWGPTEATREECRALFEKHISTGIFTPPTEQGTLMYPGNGSGTNWGSTAFDPDRGRLVLNTSRLITLVQLFPADEWNNQRKRASEEGIDYEFGRQAGAPFAFKRRTLLSSAIMPCNPPPWGEIAAIDVSTGDLAWKHPLGEWNGVEGAWNSGGPIVTGGDLVFIAATLDQKIRALDLDTGDTLWEAELPRAGIATPMTYESNGDQFVVIAAGGHGKAGMQIGDFVIAYKLSD
ncbi:MAG: pyrroloquinoline quinone-dependent dehydrogenase [Rhodothermaceae bacterium]|nr:pyrroloquinoline quinone-dependent dehydrogenase [Rhodothermaceae bacterium]